MPGIDLVGWVQDAARVKLHTSATDLLLEAYPTLRQKEISANIILAHALDRSRADGDQLRTLLLRSHQQDEGERGRQRRPAVDRALPGRNFWLTLWTISDSTPQTPELQLVVSCLSWRLGDYPIFLWSSDEPGSTSEAELDSRLQMIQKALLDAIQPRRVFSVFGRTDLVTSFERSWTSTTSLTSEPDPFYTALLTYCTKETYKSSSGSMLKSDTIRVADFIDLDSIAVLCKEFADASVYFPLTPERGREEAQWLIERQLIWLYETVGKVVSICAVARQSENVAVVTKVYTTPKWRRKGFAESLVRRVTEEMLTRKEHVALYVGTHNDAQSIYNRIGYTGLRGEDRPFGVEDVLEIGFRNTDRGYW